MLVLDGVYFHQPDRPRFHCVTAPDTNALMNLLKCLVHRIVRRLFCDALRVEDIEQLWLNPEPADGLDLRSQTPSPLRQHHARPV